MLTDPHKPPGDLNLDWYRNAANAGRTELTKLAAEVMIEYGVEIQAAIGATEPTGGDRRLTATTLAASGILTCEGPQLDKLLKSLANREVTDTDGVTRSALDVLLEALGPSPGEPDWEAPGLPSDILVARTKVERQAHETNPHRNNRQNRPEEMVHKIDRP